MKPEKPLFSSLFCSPAFFLEIAVEPPLRKWRPRVVPYGCGGIQRIRIGTKRSHSTVNGKFLFNWLNDKGDTVRDYVILLTAFISTDRYLSGINNFNR